MLVKPVLVGGSINTDLVVSVSRAPGAGETVTGVDFAIFGGGKGANQAVAAARSGAAVAMLGAVGMDDFGRARIADLQAEMIDTGSVGFNPDRPSGVALITVEASAENRIAYVPGATLGVTPDVAIDALERVNPGVVLTTLELPRETLLRLYSQARKCGTTVICNATPEPALGADIAFQADVLIVNEPEALALVEDGDSTDWTTVAQRLLSQGPETVVITLGEQGAVLATAEGVDSIPAVSVEVVDTTGAGDAFCGAFAAAMAAGRAVDECAEVGVVAGSLAATRAGAQPSMPMLLEIEAVMSRSHQPD